MIKRSYLWAGFFALAMGGWLASGELLPGSQADIKPQQAPVTKDVRFRVEVQQFSAVQRQDSLSLRGRTEAFKTLQVLVRTHGIVENSPRVEGETVKAGDILCELDVSDRKAKIARARAELASAKRDFEAAEQLAAKNYTSQAKLAAERARLDAALALAEQMRLDMGWTHVRAPISGTIAERPAEQGRYLKVGEPCAVLTVLDPILAVGQVSERHINAISVGSPAKIELISGQKLTGTIRFIAPQADVATRTFRIEVEAANLDQKIRAGITSTIDVPLPPANAHLLPSSLISLNDAGVIGVHAVLPGNAVKFLPVKLLAQSRKGAWVGGLPEKVTLITVGQHYVLDGQIIDPVARPGNTAGAQS